jgi:hypothetical protein
MSATNTPFIIAEGFTIHTSSPIVLVKALSTP